MEWHKEENNINPNKKPMITVKTTFNLFLWVHFEIKKILELTTTRKTKTGGNLIKRPREKRKPENTKQLTPRKPFFFSPISNKLKMEIKIELIRELYDKLWGP